MKKKAYLIPEAERMLLCLGCYLQTLSAPDEGIHDGGEGSDSDDPSSKKRGLSDGDGWGNLW